MPEAWLLIIEDLINNYTVDLIKTIINEINLFDINNNYSDGPNLIDLEELTIISKNVDYIDTIVNNVNFVSTSLSIFDNKPNYYEKNDLFNILSDTWYKNYNLIPIYENVFNEDWQKNYKFENFINLCETYHVHNESFIELYKLNIKTNELNSGIHLYEMCVYNNKLFPIFTSTLIKSMYFYYNTEANKAGSSHTSSSTKSTAHSPHPGGAGDISQAPFFMNDSIQKSYQNLFESISIHTHLGYHVEHNRKIYFAFLTSKEAYSSSDFDTEIKPVWKKNLKITFDPKFVSNKKQYINKIIVMDSEIFNQYFIILNNYKLLPNSFLQLSSRHLFDNTLSAYKKALKSETFIYFQPEISKIDKSSNINFFKEKKSSELRPEVDAILEKLEDKIYLKRSFDNFFDDKNDIDRFKIHQALREIKQHFK